MKTIFLLLIFHIALCLKGQSSIVFGRQVVAAAGETSAIAQGTISWTAGEAVVGSFLAANLHVNQGFQQSTLQVVSTDAAAFREQLALRIYPNPTAQILHLERLGAPKTDWMVRIFSSTGQQIALPQNRLPAESAVLSLDLSDLPAGSYFLHVQSGLTQETGVAGFLKVR